jgi:NAD dependent epimerase/dehydratase family enzyme
MSVLVTGATGRLGQALVAHLLAEGRSVHILTRRPFRAATLFGDAVAIHEWHPLSEDVPIDALAGVTAVAHLMGEPFWGRASADKLQRIRQSRLTPTRRLVAGIAGRAVRLVAASVPCLGPHATDVQVEDGQPHSGSGTALGAVAREYEEILGAYGVQGASVAVVRLGLLLGLGSDGPLQRLAGLARRFRLPLEGSRIPVIDVEDAAALFAGLLDRTALQGALHGVAPEPLRGEDLIACIAQASGKRPRLRLPRPLIRRSLGEFSAFLVNRAHVAPTRLLEAGATFRHPDPRMSLARALGNCSETAPGLWPLARTLRTS